VFILIQCDAKKLTEAVREQFFKGLYLNFIIVIFLIGAVGEGGGWLVVGDGCTVNLDRLNGFNQPKAGGGLCHILS
jgi:hypothetical protein